MRIVAALGGNALLERGEAPDAAIQHHHIVRAAQALAPLAAGHALIICHGNGPQVGMLALESEADPELSSPYPLDVLVAQTQGMIGYWVTQELHNAGVAAPVIGVLTQTVVDADDSAFDNPTKFIGSVYTHNEAAQLARVHGWTVKQDGDFWRRVVASPVPTDIVEIDTIRHLVDLGAVVICAGGGGASVVSTSRGQIVGVEAIVDKDRVSELIAERLGADLLLVLTDVDAVIRDFGTPAATPIRSATPADLAELSFPAGSMGPKIEACVQFVERTGNRAAIGALTDAVDIVAGRAGTSISFDPATAPVRHEAAARR